MVIVGEVFEIFVVDGVDFIVDVVVVIVDGIVVVVLQMGELMFVGKFFYGDGFLDWNLLFDVVYVWFCGVMLELGVYMMVGGQFLKVFEVVLVVDVELFVFGQFSGMKLVVLIGIVFGLFVVMWVQLVGCVVMNVVDWWCGQCGVDDLRVGL